MAIRTILTLIITFSSLSTRSEVNLIYGEDNRIDPQNSSSQMHKELTRSTAAMIKLDHIQSLNSREVIFKGEYDSEYLNLCSHERFFYQPKAAHCSGFLIAPNKIVTAGHCMDERGALRKSAWVFDYNADSETQEEVIVQKKNIYTMKRLLSHRNHDTFGDFAVIELDRNVEDRAFLKYRTQGKPNLGDDVFVIGYPNGLPAKIADGAQIKDLGPFYFEANLDTYHGNSGSPVFNATTGVVEGILTRGRVDQVKADGETCEVSNVLTDYERNNEGVVLIGVVEGL